MDSCQPASVTPSSSVELLSSLLSEVQSRRQKESEAERIESERVRQLEARKAQRQRLVDAFERAYRFTNEETEQGRKPSSDGFRRWADRFRDLGAVMRECEQTLDQLRFQDRLRDVGDSKAPAPLKLACLVLLLSFEDQIDAVARALESTNCDAELRRFVLWLPYIRDNLWFPYGGEGKGPVAHAEPPEGTPFEEAVDANAAFGWRPLLLPIGFEALNKLKRDGLTATVLEEWSKRWEDIGRRYPDADAPGMPAPELAAELNNFFREFRQAAELMRDPPRLTGIEAIEQRIRTMRTVWEVCASSKIPVDYSKEIDDLRAYWHDEYQVGTIAFSPPLVAKVTVRGEALDALIVLEHGLRPEVEQEQGDLETTAEVGESPVVANVDQAVPGTSCDSQILALDSAGKVFRFNLEEAKIWDAIVPGVGNFDKLIYLYDQWFQHRGNFLMPPELAGTDSPNYARYRTREQARDWFLAHDKVLHPDAASLKSQDQVDAVNNLAASRLPAELADLAVADAPTATAPTVSQSVATELNQIPDEVADREIRRTQPNGKTDSSTWQEQEQGLGEDQRPEFPTCEFCLIPPNRLRWQGEVTVEPRLWRLLGMAIRSMGTAIPFESIQEQIHADKPVNDKTIRNEIYELNKHLLDIAFPWGVAPKHSHLVRKPDGP